MGFFLNADRKHDSVIPKILNGILNWVKIGFQKFLWDARPYSALVWMGTLWAFTGLYIYLERHLGSAWLMASQKSSTVESRLCILGMQSKNEEKMPGEQPTSCRTASGAGLSRRSEALAAPTSHCKKEGDALWESFPSQLSLLSVPKLASYYPSNYVKCEHGCTL